MNVLSLFSGIGGLELGLERAGMTVVGQVEIDPFCRRVLAKHWPDVPRHDDVRTCVEWWRSGPRPAVHVVAGGFPCQPVSLAGRGQAQADERWLWPAMWAVIRDLRPDWALLENVPGLLGRGMGDVLGDLAAGGYDAEWDCIPAAAVGAHHRRDRVFVVACPSGQRRRLQPVTKPRSSHPTVPADDGAARHVADAPRNGRGQGRSGRSAGDGPHRAGLAPEELADPDREPRGPLGPVPPRGGAGTPGQRPTQPGGRGFSRVFGRDRGRPAHWATEPDVGRVAHGVPDRVDRLRALGNAVVPQVAEHIGRLVMEAACPSPTS